MVTDRDVSVEPRVLSDQRIGVPTQIQPRRFSVDPQFLRALLHANRISRLTHLRRNSRERIFSDGWGKVVANPPPAIYRPIGMCLALLVLCGCGLGFSFCDALSFMKRLVISILFLTLVLLLTLLVLPLLTQFEMTTKFRQVLGQFGM